MPTCPGGCCIEYPELSAVVSGFTSCPDCQGNPSGGGGGYKYVSHTDITGMWTVPYGGEGSYSWVLNIGTLTYDIYTNIFCSEFVEQVTVNVILSLTCTCGAYGAQIAVDGPVNFHLFDNPDGFAIGEEIPNAITDCSFLTVAFTGPITLAVP